MSPPRVLCDEMLGRLARWLRLLGIDAAYLQDLDDASLLAAARREGRVLVTRDAQLVARAGAGSALLVASLELEEQLREVVAGMGLKVQEALVMSRCSVCNVPLVEAARGEAEGKVPESVWASRKEYWRCPSCGRFYWRGTHAERIEATLRGLAEEHGA